MTTDFTTPLLSYFDIYMSTNTWHMAFGVGATLGRVVRAPLANPYAMAQPGDEASQTFFPAVDFALRTIAHAMLRPADTDACATDGGNPPVLSDGERQLLLSERFPRTEVAACLTYLRDRVGVPRDMTVHGARQLRAHINWLLDYIKE